MRKPKLPPGSRWRVLVYGDGGTNPGHHFMPDPDDVPRPAGYTDAEYADYRATVLADRDLAVRRGHATYTPLPGTVFDELVVDSWLHVEQMDTDQWFLHVAGMRIAVRVGKDGVARSVLVEGPAEFAGPVPGCTYECDWSDANDTPADGDAS